MPAASPQGCDPCASTAPGVKMFRCPAEDDVAGGGADGSWFRVGEDPIGDEWRTSAGA